MMKTRITKTPRSNYKHSYRQTVSTSADFSFVQPTFFRPLLADSKINVNLKQFVRLTPLPFPTFGEVKLCNAARFVPIEQVYPAYAAFMSEKEYTLPDGTLYIPKYLPNISLHNLMDGFLQQFATATPYSAAVANSPLDAPIIPRSLFDLKIATEYFKVGQGGFVSTKEMPDVDGNMKTVEVCTPLDSELVSLLDRLVETTDNTEAEALNNEYLLLMKSRGYDLGKSGENANVSGIAVTSEELAAADYVAYNKDAAGNNSLTLYKFHNRGKALMKIFYGLGIQPSLDDYSCINVLPLLACYKAYFDRFFPTRLHDWMATRTYRFIKWVEEHDITDYSTIGRRGSSDSSNSAQYASYFYAVMQDLTELYTTVDLDFISAQTRTIGNGQAPASYPLTIANGGQALNTNVGVSPSNLTDFPVEPSGSPYIPNGSQHTSDGTEFIPAISKLPVSKWQIDLLKRMTNYVVKDSLIGNRIQLWMRTHLGEDVYNIIYHESNDCGYSETDITIGDIDSTADTVEQGGDYLGSYAGKGVGSGNLNINFRANTFGYLFAFTWIKVNTSWYQGTDEPHFAVSRYQIAQPDFDALGYEVSHRSTVWTDNGISVGDYVGPNIVTGTQVDVKTTDGFGYMPRYSGWKYIKNIVSGDFRLRSVQSTMQSFYVDRMILSRYNDTADKVGNVTPYKPAIRAIPLASSQWQYQGRYDWIGNYNRIFANYTYNEKSGSNGTTYDNFYIHQVNDVTEINCLKPLSVSFDVGSGIDMSVNRS